jgi:hypothetical protein
MATIYARSIMYVFAVALTAVLSVTSAPSLAQSCGGMVARDWMDADDPLAARVRPGDCTTVEQSPPDFGWPQLHNLARYEMTLTYPDGRKRSIPTENNWLNWPEALPPGTYSWSVKMTIPPGTQASRARKFTVPEGATTFVLPDVSATVARVAARPHPRGQPDPMERYTMLMQRLPAYFMLVGDSAGRLGRPTSEPTGSRGNVEDAMIEESKRLLKFLAACAYSGYDPFCEDAAKIAVAMAAWDPRGATSYANVDMGSRSITWAAALAYDWLHARLTPAQRSNLLGMLKVRTGDMYADLIGTPSRIAKYPRDSHANQTLMMLPAISALLAGDLPEATTWLTVSLPAAVNAVSPWGGEDGGFANSASQGVWDVGEQLLPWYVLRWTGAVDLAGKAWVRNWARYQAYFMPPGQKSQVFGDGLELDLTENRSRFGAGYANFVATPLAKWYAASTPGQDPMRVESLFSPAAGAESAALPAGTPNSLLVPSIGWAAMHSDLADPNRISVYFKSSPPPFGAFNHSHADQNSFVINGWGERLAIESGYYDGYKSAHWSNWYKQTRAKNAITFDGGQGQLFYERDEKMGYGGITQFESGQGYDLVSGDATAAYGGALTRARRSMVYLKPYNVLVYDTLASDTARVYEWNIHALKRMGEPTAGKVELWTGKSSLCVDMLAAPPVRFSQNDAWSSAPSRGEPQWHGRFSNVTPTPAVEYIALIRVGCAPANASATNANGVWTVNVDGQAVTFSPEAGARVVR